MTGIIPTKSSNFQTAVMQVEAAQKVQAPVALQTPALDADGNPVESIDQIIARQQVAGPKKDDAVQDKFQEFVAGSFYKLMLKSLRSAQKPSKYFNGGQAEKIFQGQLDEQFADKMQKKNGRAISAPMFPAFARAAMGGSAVNEATAASNSAGTRPYSPAILPAAEEVGHALNVTQ